MSKNRFVLTPKAFSQANGFAKAFLANLGSILAIGIAMPVLALVFAVVSVINIAMFIICAVLLPLVFIFEIVTYKK